MSDAAPSAPKEIRFYRASEKPYGCFSNLYRRPFEFEGKTYSTAEAAYQAGKPRADAVRRWILDAPSPSLLAMAAHGLAYWDIAPGWSKNRRTRMKAVVQAKFAQHKDLADLLVGTGAARLVETGTVDNDVNRRWGEVKGVGENGLGIILMEVRGELGGTGVIARTPPRLGLDPSRPLLFLDIDGVLNCSFNSREQIGMFHVEPVLAFRKFLQAVTPQVVLSSTWRSIIHAGYMTVKGFESLLLTHRIRCELIDVTAKDLGDVDPFQRPTRAAQIADWLNQHHMEQPYVVIDDDDDGISAAGHPFVQTNGAFGFTAEDGERAIQLLEEQRKVLT